MRSPRSLPRLTAVLAASALFFAACGDDDDVDASAVDDTVEETGDEVTETDSEEMTDVETETTDTEIGVVEAQLEPLNESGISGTATVQMNADQTFTVTVETEGFTGMNPHAQHLHIGGENRCPDMTDAGDDGVLTTADGIPAYGEVKVALTTEGDVSAESALAVERFPTADESGMVSYERTFELPAGVTPDDVSRAVVVQHGLASMGGDPAAYDGDMKSSLDPSLPLEATIPVACAPLEQ